MPSRLAASILLLLAFVLATVIALPVLASTPSAYSPDQQSLSGRPLFEDLPPGVRVETVLEGMHLPIALAFDPSGRLFYTEKDGNVRLFANGQLQSAPVISFKVDTGS